MDLISIIISFLISIIGSKDNLKSYYVYKTNFDKLALIANFTEKTSSKILSDDNNCVAGINGGFYGTDNKPVGWFVNDKFVQKAKNSQLFNGFVSNKGTSSEKPENAVWGFQTGPMILVKNKPIDLSLINDKPARRSVLAGNSKQVMLINVDPIDLVDLPQKIEEISKKEKLNIETAINLDGGAASAFISPEISISETDPVGSWLCVKSPEF